MAQTQAPPTLWLAVAGLLIEAVEALCFAVVLVVLAVSVHAGGVGGAVALAVMFAVIAAGLVGLGLGTVRARRWARPASVAWQIVLVLSAVSGLLGSVWVVVALVAPAALTLLGTFLPPSLRYYDGRLKAAEEARRSEQSGPPEL